MENFKTLAQDLTRELDFSIKTQLGIETCDECDRILTESNRDVIHAGSCKACIWDLRGGNTWG